jgi:DNA-binding MarR family transcriptional regulator
MSLDANQQAFDRDIAELETLFPRVWRKVFPSVEEDPLGALPVAQLRIVRVLNEGSKTVSELAAELQMSASAVTHVLGRLEEKGIVLRQVAGEDRRRRVLELSAESREAFLQRKACRVQRLSKLAQGEHQKLFAELASVLSRLDSVLGEPQNLHTDPH